MCIRDRVLYYCQVSELLAKGFLSRLKYYDVTRIDLTKVRRNSSGADFDDASLSDEFRRVDLYGYLISIVKRLLHPKVGGARKGMLVFTRFTAEAEKMCIRDRIRAHDEKPVRQPDR